MAILEFVERHVTFSVLSTGDITVFNCIDCPSFNVIVFGLILSFTVKTFTFTMQLATFPFSVLTQTVVVPADFAVISPLLFTVAIDESSIVHVSF